PGQALCRLPVVVLPARPIHQMALLPAPRRKSVGERIAGIGLEHQPEQTQRLLVVFRGFGKRRWYRAAGQIVDVLLASGLRRARSTSAPRNTGPTEPIR